MRILGVKLVSDQVPFSWVVREWLLQYSNVRKIVKYWKQVRLESAEEDGHNDYRGMVYDIYTSRLAFKSATSYPGRDQERHLGDRTRETDGMADPLSIVTGVLGLLGICVKVGSALKDFYDGAAIADTKVKGLLTDVESFTQVLQLMKDTFEQEQIQTSFQATGHIGNHWNNLSTSIRDGQNTLLQLQETLERVNKSVTFKESTAKILPNLDELNQAIRQIAHDISNLVESNASDTQLLALNNLRNCVQSAASIVSSASTTLGVEPADPFSVAYGSEFGDCFPFEPGETMIRWISSNTVYEFEEEPAAESSSRRRNLTSGNLQSVEEDAEQEQSDSDTDLEVEIFQALLKRGKEKFQAKDFGDAERLFRNCLTRISSNGSMASLHHTPRSKSEIMTLLLDVYLAEEKWNEAQSLLLDKIALGSRGMSSDNGRVLLDMLALVDVLIRKNSYAEALLYGRRALKGYRKMGSDGVLGVENSLKVLVRVCHLDGNYDEEDAYAAILSDFLQLNASEPNKTEVGQSNLQFPDAPTSIPNRLPLGGSSVAGASSSGGPITAATDSSSNGPFLQVAPSHFPIIGSPATEASHSTVSLLSLPAIEYIRAQSTEPPAELPGEPPAMLETADVSSINDAKPKLLAVASTSNPEATPRVKNGQVIKEIVSVPASLVPPSVPTSSSSETSAKIVLVGDCYCGKTNLLNVFAKGVFPEKYELTIQETYVADVELDGKEMELALWDTGGMEDLDRIRPLAYPDSHVILICFAIDVPDSLDNVLEKWISEILHFCEGVPIILLGLKKDLRYDHKVTDELFRTHQKPVSEEQGEEARKQIGASKYLECSALTNEGVHKVFEHATRAALYTMKKKEKEKKTEQRKRAFRRLFSRSSS
ncbi:hypothetical protein EG329_008848 [Mollisiaceae sp. DMI_Dod_QoI]|nr:hypothetical protein EG329_008848 [Helotiales sp. DMI_Dod_QoI]